MFLALHNKTIHEKPLDGIMRYTPHVRLLDDRPFSYRTNPHLGVSISTWTGDPKDRELERVKLKLMDIWTQLFYVCFEGP
jgi:TFIIF-interacting CTD phosphatase-like protein